MLHVACCMVVNRVLSHSSHFPSRTYLFPIIILSIRTVSAGILESGRTLNSQHTCTNVTSPSPGILQLFRFHLSECLVACWEIDGAVRVFHSKSICCKSNPIERALGGQTTWMLVWESGHGGDALLLLQPQRSSRLSGIVIRWIIPPRTLIKYIWWWTLMSRRRQRRNVRLLNHSSDPPKAPNHQIAGGYLRIQQQPHRFCCHTNK